MHLDGARLWNAAAATVISAKQWAAPFDTVSVCFSKGLGAPVGSGLVGSTDLMARARRFRKMFGGGMRQAGIIAAGALFALRNHRDRLKEDHANAKALAEGIARCKGFEVDLAGVQTNIVVIRVTAMSASEFPARLKTRGVGMLPTGPDTCAVVSLEVNREQVLEAVEVVKDVVRSDRS